MPSDFQLKTMNAMHKAVLKLSFGHLGWNASSMPVLELTTIGRKSGQPRSVMLTRRTATVTISAPLSSTALRVSAKSLYLPVPTMRRDLKVLPASLKGES